MSHSRKVQIIDYPSYIQAEQTSPIKHELINGELFAMTGGSIRHDIIKNNLISILNQHLRQSPCLVLGGDANLRVESFRNENGYYPDAMVCCDQADNQDYYRRKPVLVAEVLSESSRITDKTLKKADYFSISSLREYALIEQDRMEIIIYRRLEASWEEETCREGDLIRFGSVDFSCAIEDLYLKTGL